MITIICAIAENGAIGYQNQLLFRLRADMQRFRSLTTGNTVIMGRRTFESLPKGALPNRRNIVLTRSTHIAETKAGAPPAREDSAIFSAKGIEVFPSLTEALKACKPDEDIYIIGGASVYAKAMPLADRLMLTFVHATPAEADTYFPEVDWSQWQCTNKEEHYADDDNECAYTFAEYRKKNIKSEEIVPR